MRWLKQLFKKKQLNIQVEGTYENNYSLSIVNKAIAKALQNQENTNVKISATKYHEAYMKEQTDIEDAIKTLEAKTLKNIDVSIRNIYPPHTQDMQGTQKIIGPYGWEESEFPKEYVEAFNKDLTLLLTMSDYVKNVLQNNGVKTPMLTTGIIVEDILEVAPEPFVFDLPDGFKLLHISCAFPRKGVDILLKTFTLLADDTTSLILKTSPNPHNDILNQLENLNFRLKHTYEEDIFLFSNNTKSILLINKHISQSKLKYLYENSNVLVAPSLGEGFGLPMAEAMLLDLPVITTAFGGQSDFCTADTSWLIDFDFDFAKTHLSLQNSLWQVPKISSLKTIIEEFSSISKEQVTLKTKKAKEYILENYSSKKVAQNITNALYQKHQKRPNEKIALFSTFNTRCGIALYSKYLISSFEDKVTILANKTTDSLIEKDTKNTIRCWEARGFLTNIIKLKQQLQKQKITTLIIQYNFSFLSLPQLEKLILFCAKNSIKTYLFLHSTKDVVQDTYTDSFKDIALSLQKVNQIYVHTLEDINYLKGFNIYKNTAIFTHGINTAFMQPISKNTPQDTLTLATFGFLLPQKGIFELVDIVEKLHQKGKKVKLLLLTSIHPNPISKNLELELRKKIQNSDISQYITLNTEYLEEKEILSLLSKVDKLLFLYKQTQESSSAAVRMGLLSQKEVITTPIPIFNDVKEVVTQPSTSEQKDILETIESCLSEAYDNTKQLQWIQKNSWMQISHDFYAKVR